MIESKTAVELDSERERLKTLQNRANLISHALDDRFKIPGTSIRYGFDSLIGFIPVVGDSITLGVSGYTVYLARRAGIRKRIIAKMLKNIGVDYVVGLVPLVGDIFDFAIKANLKNAKLINEEIEHRLQQLEQEGSITVEPAAQWNQT